LGKSLSAYYVQNADLCFKDTLTPGTFCSAMSVNFLDANAFLELDSEADWKFLKDD